MVECFHVVCINLEKKKNFIISCRILSRKKNEVVTLGAMTVMRQALERMFTEISI